MDKAVCKFGCWSSTVSAESVAGKTLRFQTLHGLGDTLYWTEQRPAEKGRSALVCALSVASSPAGSEQNYHLRELLEAPWSVATRVHEYGGNAFLVTEKTIFFVNQEDQQIWSIANAPESKAPNPPVQITRIPDLRFADLIYDRARNRLICVAEQALESKAHPLNFLASISLDGTTAGQVAALAEGHDFYAAPRLSPDGQRLAFLCWNLPAMPWEAARLCLASLDEAGAVTETSSPANTLEGASFQPEWDDAGHLWFINDSSGFGQLYRFDGREITHFPAPPEQAESGLPLWVFGMKTYGFLAGRTIAVSSLVAGNATLSLVPMEKGGENTPVAAPPAERENKNGDDLSTICTLDQLVTLDDHTKEPALVAAIVSRPHKPDAIALISPETGRVSDFKTGSTLDLLPEDISVAQTLAFKNELGQTVYGNYYPPVNSKYEAPPDERPPVILTAHGGPTGWSPRGLKAKTQFWTSRGFGYFDVNYSGSWGFGRAYRERLDGQWGVRDVADMEAAARHLVATDRADPHRLLISGSSAGGYTVLMTLVNSSLFAAGASYYGISDLARLCESTHKFEAGYIERLLGLSPQNRDRILATRSPLFQADKISAPMIFFQGLKDKVVPPDQAEEMVKALAKQGLEVRYQTFATEGHGFRSSQTIRTALEREYEFYRDILKL